MSDEQGEAEGGWRQSGPPAGNENTRAEIPDFASEIRELTTGLF
jgi:hypothetical protein